MKQTKLIQLALIYLICFSSSQAALDIVIQPGAQMNSVIWNVEWTNLDGESNADSDTFAWSAMNPSDGSTLSTEPWGAVPQIQWDNLGDSWSNFFTIGDDHGLVDGFGGVVSSVSGYGVGPDYDSGLDDIYIFNIDPGFIIPTSGSFQLTIPNHPISAYNIGIFDSNPDATVTVLTTPVPEISHFTLVTSLICGWFILRRKKQLF